MENTEAHQNYMAYLDRYEQRLEVDHLGRVALMHNREVVNIYNDMDDAYSIGCEKYGLGNFSLQKIGARPIQLGIMAIAVS